MPSNSPQSAPPPAAVLMQMLGGKMVTQMIRTAALFGIADLLKEGPRSIDDLAAASQTHAPSLYRLLRALASLGVFTEQEDRRFALTPLAEYLRSDAPGSMRQMAMMTGDEWQMHVWADLPYSIRTGGIAFEHVFEQPGFTYLQQHPESAAIFNGAMTDFSRLAVPTIVSAYDFSGIRHLMDVGGGHGLLISGILHANPQLRGTVYDLPFVIEGTRPAIAAQGLAERCQCQTGDFFAGVPAGADAYLMKHIIHDWDDAQSIQILRHCRGALADVPNGRVLVIEHLVPPANEPSFAKLLDLEMLLIPGGKERTADEFRNLFQAAGFRLNRIVPTPGPLVILEAVPA